MPWIIVGAVLFLLLVAMVVGNRPLSMQDFELLVDKSLNKLRSKSSKLRNASILIHSPSRGIHSSIKSPHAFHVASVGKMFTAILIQKAITIRKLSWDTKVEALLKVGLDPDITVLHLITHTSGLPDYFDGPTTDGTPTIFETMQKSPTTSWTPQDLLSHSITHQGPGTRPSEAYLYSDTGFVVLGLVLETIHGQSFESLVHQEIFDPLGMDDTYFPFRTTPKSGKTPALRPTWLGDVDLSTSRALTADWAGGGVASTEEDMLTFARALQTHTLVSSDDLESMAKPMNKFNTGIYYGRGMMTLKFGDFFPLLGTLPNLVGHMGVLGTQVFFDPKSDLVVIVSLGATGFMPESVMLIIDALGALARVRVPITAQ